MEININSDDVNNHIKEAILQSTVGKTITISIEKALKELFDSYRSPIKEFVNQHLREMVKEHMEKQDVKPLLIQAIEKHLTPETISLIVSNGLYELQKRMKEND
jgi:signal recognition particle GTPase